MVSRCVGFAVEGFWIGSKKNQHMFWDKPIFKRFYTDFAQIFWIFTNLMVHGFQDTRVFPGSKNCVSLQLNWKKKETNMSKSVFKVSSWNIAYLSAVFLSFQTMVFIENLSMSTILGHFICAFFLLISLSFTLEND